VRGGGGGGRGRGGGAGFGGHSEDEAGPGVTGVEDALEGVFGFEESVGFVNEQGGTELLDGGEQGGGTYIGGNQRTVHKAAEEGQQSGLPAAASGRFDADVSGDVAKLESVGVKNPKRERFGCPLGEDDKAGEELTKGIKQELALRCRRLD